MNQCWVGVHIIRVVSAGDLHGLVFDGGIRALQTAAFALPSFSHFDDLILFNALAFHSGQLLRLIEEELDGPEKEVR